MNTIDKKLKKAQETLNNFNEIMKVIKKYPIKIINQPYSSLPYRIPKPHRY